MDGCCRVNLIVQLTNSTVNPHMSYAEIHPKVADNGADIGRYPRDFERPRRLEEFYVMDCLSPSPPVLYIASYRERERLTPPASTLDRILQSYSLPTNLRGGVPNSLFPTILRSTSGIGTLGLNNESGNRDYKLKILFEFLGVDLSDGGRGGVLGLGGGNLGLGLGSGLGSGRLRGFLQ